MSGMYDEPFWHQTCPARGAGLPHHHDSMCDAEATHPGSNDRHAWKQCCLCGQYEVSANQDVAMREAGVVTKLADPDSLPLALVTGRSCDWRHRALAKDTPLIGDKGFEWPICPDCGDAVEPKLATGVLTGGPAGIGRGWVSPRMQNRWRAIRFRVLGVL